MLNDVHVMIDIETLGTSSRSVIRSIGAVLFTPANFGKEFNIEASYDNIEISSCLAIGLEIDVDTAKWWSEQNQEAVNRLYRPLPVSLKEALRVLKNFCVLNKVSYFWSHGSTFDIVILQEAMRLLGMESFMPFRDACDTRTLARLTGLKYKFDEWKHSEFQNTHDALADALAQARWAEMAVNKNCYAISKYVEESEGFEKSI